MVRETPKRVLEESLFDNVTVATKSRTKTPFDPVVRFRSPFEEIKVFLIISFLSFIV